MPEVCSLADQAPLAFVVAELPASGPLMLTPSLAPKPEPETVKASPAVMLAGEMLRAIGALVVGAGP